MEFYPVATAEKGKGVTMSFTPLVPYQNYQHVLNALPCFVHPVSGAIYGIAIEKQSSGARQNLSVYRVRPGSQVRELIKRYVGGIDSQAQIAAGGCVIDQAGALHVWASAIPVGVPPITQTGFVGGFWEPIAGVDLPWGGTGGSGGVHLFDAPYLSPAWDNRPLTTGVLVDIPSVFGCPSHSVYLVRFCAIAPQANVRARAGTQSFPYLLTVNTPAPGVEADGQGLIPGPICYISPARGIPSVWLQIVGWA